MTFDLIKDPIHALFVIHILDISKHYLGFEHTINADAIEQFEMFICNHILTETQYANNVALLQQNNPVFRKFAPNDCFEISAKTNVVHLILSFGFAKSW